MKKLILMFLTLTLMQLNAINKQEKRTISKQKEFAKGCAFLGIGAVFGCLLYKSPKFANIPKVTTEIEVLDAREYSHRCIDRNRPNLANAARELQLFTILLALPAYECLMRGFKHLLLSIKSEENKP